MRTATGRNILQRPRLLRSGLRRFTRVSLIALISVSLLGGLASVAQASTGSYATGGLRCPGTVSYRTVTFSVGAPAVSSAYDEHQTIWWIPELMAWTATSGWYHFSWGRWNYTISSGSSTGDADGYVSWGNLAWYETNGYQNSDLSQHFNVTLGGQPTYFAVRNHIRWSPTATDPAGGTVVALSNVEVMGYLTSYTNCGPYRW
jgi:hypothetical protein